MAKAWPIDPEYALRAANHRDSEIENVNCGTCAHFQLFTRKCGYFLRSDTLDFDKMPNTLQTNVCDQWEQ